MVIRRFFHRSRRGACRGGERPYEFYHTSVLNVEATIGRPNPRGTGKTTFYHFLQPQCVLFRTAEAREEILRFGALRVREKLRRVALFADDALVHWYGLPKFGTQIWQATVQELSLRPGRSP